MLDPATNPAVLQQQDYAELKRRIVAAALLEKQPGYYVFNASVRLAHLDASIALLFIINNLWLQLLNAAFLAFAFTQVGFLGHDGGHGDAFWSVALPVRAAEDGPAMIVLGDWIEMEAPRGSPHRRQGYQAAADSQ